MTTVRRSYRELVSQLQFAQKSVIGVPAYMRYVNRPTGGRLAVVCYLLGLTPAQVTGVSALLSFTGIAVVALARPTALTSLVVGLALVLGFAFDSADGQLARLRGGGSPAGEWLDHVVDAVKSSTLHSAVAVSLYRYGQLGHQALLLLPLAFIIVGGAHYFGMMLGGVLSRGAPRGGRSESSAARDGTLSRALLLLPLDYGLLCLTFFVLALTPVFLVLYGGLLACTAVFSVYSLTKAYRQLLRLPAP